MEWEKELSLKQEKAICETNIEILKKYPEESYTITASILTLHVFDYFIHFRLAKDLNSGFTAQKAKEIEAVMQ